MLLAHQISIPKRMMFWNHKGSFTGTVISTKNFLVGVKIDNSDRTIYVNLRYANWASLDVN